MLIRFVYLDRPTLEGFAAQTAVSSRRPAKAEGGGQDDREWTMSYPHEAQFQRLLAVVADHRLI